MRFNQKDSPQLCFGESSLSKLIPLMQIKIKTFSKVEKDRFDYHYYNYFKRKPMGETKKGKINFPRFEISKPIFLIFQLKSFCGTR
jgi:hypothetical protein